MSRLGISQGAITKRFPRVSGDEPIIKRTLVDWALFSPRERG